jgi:transposase-like protein
LNCDAIKTDISRALRVCWQIEELRVTPEQMELSRVRAEIARLRMENEIVKKATAYFAKDAL